MRSLLIILSCFLLLLTGQPPLMAQTVPPGQTAQKARQATDTLLARALRHAVQYDDSTLLLANQALATAQTAGYTHGIALALACKAAYTEYQLNDFVTAEKEARQSLEWYGRTPDKTNIAVAWYALSFSVFAQSRFGEAIANLRQARDAAQKDGDSVNYIHSLSLTGCAYRESGDYAKAFDTIRQCIRLAQNLHLPYLLQEQYFELAAIFLQIEDYGSAAKYFHTGFGVCKTTFCSTWTTMVYAELLAQQHQFDSAAYYYNSFDSAAATPAMLRTYLVSKGEFLVWLGRPAEALPYFDKSLQYQRKLNDRNQLMRCLKDLAMASRQLNRPKDAYRYAREGLSIATAYRARQFIRDNYGILHSLYDQEGRTDSAYACYRRYITMKDSVNNEQLKGQFASRGFEQQIAWLKQEQQLQQACINEQAMTKKLLIGGILALLLIGFIFSRYVLLKRKNEAHLRQRAENQLEIQRLEGEKTRSALQQKAKELEIQALRSQMNPHFIFNCLNAINRFILSHETETAADYLTKFSRLMRMTMNHSRHPQITLAEELEMLELYLDMEKLRFRNAFDHHMRIADNLDPEDIYIPPLLMQPFVENAIWHGLMHKKERGSLCIAISLRNNVLTCVISDNGIGRTRAGLLKSRSAQRHKSMGLQITAERLALLAGEDGPQHHFIIEDLYDAQDRPAGTQVTLSIKIDIMQYST